MEAYLQSSSKRISVPMRESPHRLKIHFPNERLHASFSACLKYVTHIAALRLPMTFVSHFHRYLSQIIKTYAKTATLYLAKLNYQF